MSDEINLLAEICDDPDDTDSDYGRGFAAGVAAGRKQAADAIRAHARLDIDYLAKISEGEHHA